MEYEVKDIQHQSHGSDDGIQEKIVLTVEYTDVGYSNTAFLQFDADIPDTAIVANIEAHGKSLVPKNQKAYKFAKSGVIK